MFDSLPGYTSVYYCKQSYLKGERKNSCFHHLVCLCLRFRTTPKNCLSDLFEMNKVFSNAADFFFSEVYKASRFPYTLNVDIFGA